MKYDPLNSILNKESEKLQDINEEKLLEIDVLIGSIKMDLENLEVDSKLKIKNTVDQARVIQKIDNIELFARLKDPRKLDFSSRDVFDLNIYLEDGQAICKLEAEFNSDSDRYELKANINPKDRLILALENRSGAENIEIQSSILE